MWPLRGAIEGFEAVEQLLLQGFVAIQGQREPSARPAETQSTVVTLVGDGAGGFTTAGTKNLAGLGTIWFLTTGDLNEDTKADVLVTSVPGGFSVLCVLSVSVPDSA